MLNECNGSIVEDIATANSGTSVSYIDSGTATDSCTYTSPTIWWGNYPVYVCTDKTAKAIEILKLLQAEKLIECKSVPKFIALVEKIAGTL